MGLSPLGSLSGSHAGLLSVKMALDDALCQRGGRPVLERELVFEDDFGNVT